LSYTLTTTFCIHHLANNSFRFTTADAVVVSQLHASASASCDDSI